MKFYSDDWLTIYQGDVRAVLPELASESVDCIVTSPPYWGLRDYGTAAWAGGDAECDHLAPATKPRAERPNPSGAGIGMGGPSWDAQELATRVYKTTCGKCGALRQDSQLGLERTPEEYVANMVAVFRELRRVLKPSGTCWLNLGDSYASSPPGNTTKGVSGASTLHGVNGESGRYRETLDAGHATKRNTVVGGLKPKDLVGIPWMVAFALQADGWYLRSDIIWSKPNPMPESVTDRPTKAHEYLFLLTKSARYYFDADAVREAHVRQWDAATNGAVGHNNGHGDWGQSGKGMPEPNPAGRNLRSVWTIATRPYPGAHFAVFPPELPERCIKAGSSERGVCPETGEPWERVTERQGGERYATGKSAAKNGAGLATAFSGYTDGSSAPTFTTVGWEPTCGAPWERVVEKPQSGNHDGQVAPRYEGTGLNRYTGEKSPGVKRYPASAQLWGQERVLSGWRPTCGHDAEPVPAVVLDPFAGSGTTGMVANRLSRRAILIDLNGDYLKQQLERNAQTPLGLV